MDKVDIIINVFGKPWQTLCTLNSLLKHSGNHIDKIYFIEEKCQPYGNSVNWIIEKFGNIVHYIPQEHYGVSSFVVNSDHAKTDIDRFNFRYQYGIEKSDKKYVFLTHNDILYTNDIIGNMLSDIEDNVGIGLIGQCWNCPAFHAGLCNSEKFNSYKPTYEDIQELFKTHTPVRYHFYQWLDKDHVMPMPECRLNEFACLINREITLKESMPNGNVPFFGSMGILDTGCSWFKGMCLLGYKFKHYDINKDSSHGYFSKLASSERDYTKDDSFFVSGYITQLHEKEYWEAEKNAEEYYNQNFI